MDARRRSLLVWLLACPIMAGVPIRSAFSQDSSERSIDLRIEGRRVVSPNTVIRIAEGEVVKLLWATDEAVELHLHGYDLLLDVRPGEPAAMVVEAYAAGRFPVTSHGWGEGGPGHETLIYLEVYPR